MMAVNQLKRFPLRVKRRRFLLFLLLPACALMLYACAGCWLARREIVRTPRNAATGVVLGTEALDLDPPAGAPRPTRVCLLLHGFIGSRQDFNGFGARLAAAGYHVRMARLPGHGTTPLDLAGQTPESLYAGVHAEYRALRQRYATVDVVGYSLGGALATQLAAREDIHRLVLAAPFYAVTYHWFRRRLF